TAPDGYQAQRSYSVASAPGGDTIEITVEHVDEGEVSPFLLGEVVVGDTLELRGPIGGYFTWEAGEGGPLLLIAGGSGIAPLMAILRHRAKAGDGTPVRLLYSSRSHDGIIYREELDRMAETNAGFALTHALTREQPPGWKGERRRIDRAMIEASGVSADQNPRAFVCGPTPLVEQVASDLIALGYPEARVKTERFGPTGDAK
ncbi:MAG: Flavodoxin reductases (ferredoxin-NADPH reductases) family 1, partial [uncultured Microvirga sp.]